MLFNEPIQSTPQPGAVSEERLRGGGVFPVPPMPCEEGREPTVLCRISRGTLVPPHSIAAGVDPLQESGVALTVRVDPPPSRKRDRGAPAASTPPAVQQLESWSDRDGAPALPGGFTANGLSDIHRGVALLTSAATDLAASRDATGAEEPSSRKRHGTWILQQARALCLTRENNSSRAVK